MLFNSPPIRFGEGAVVEMGAAWIHGGSSNNPLYALAETLKLPMVRMITFGDPVMNVYK